MSLDTFLLEILACPEDKGPLYYFEDEAILYNPRLRRVYEIRDGIPVMLIDESRTVDDTEHRRLIDKAESQGVGLNWTPEGGSGGGVDASTGDDSGVTGGSG